MKKLIAVILALALALALAGCGSEAKEVDIDALAAELVGAASFGEPMNALDSAVALGLYGAPEGTAVAAYAGTGATAEEVAVFDCGSAGAAESLAEALTARNETRISQYADYNPAEVPKLEDAVILTGGQYAVLIVASDPSAAESIAADAIK